MSFYLNRPELLEKTPDAQAYSLNENNVCEDYLVAAFTLLLRSGYRASIEWNLADWRDTMMSMPGITGVNAAYNPDVNPDMTAFWVRITHSSGQIAAIMACRLYVTQAYYDLLRTGLLWVSEGVDHPMTCHLEGDGPKGRISHSGGIWVHPDHRGNGLSWVLPRIVGALSVRQWQIDEHTGIVQDKLLGKGVPAKNYGVSSIKLALTGYFFITGKEERLFSVQTSRRDIVERSARDLEIILGEGHKQVRDLAPIAKQRKN